MLPIHILYAIAAAYDGLLGIAFLLAGPQLFDLLGIPPPNHWGFVHFAAGLLIIFGLMFLAVARNPVENRNLVVYGLLLKVCYISTVVWHWINGDVSHVWKYFAGADMAFILAFLWSQPYLNDPPKTTS